MFSTIKYINVDTKELIYQEDTEEKIPDTDDIIVLMNTTWKIDKTTFTAQYTECYLKKI